MLKTFIVDGDKGGVGKSMVARALIDMYVNAPESGMPSCSVGVIDGDHGNSDICGKGGIDHRFEAQFPIKEILDLKTQEGWAKLADELEYAIHSDTNYRVIISMPAGVGHAVFNGSQSVIHDIMVAINAIPVWIFNRTLESVKALEKRLEKHPDIFLPGHGIAVRNTFFGSPDKFEVWNGNPLKTKLGWKDADFPELYSMAVVAVGRQPFWMAGEEGIGDQYRKLGFGEKLTLNAWRRSAWKSLAVVESVPGLAEI